ERDEKGWLDSCHPAPLSLAISAVATMGSHGAVAARRNHLTDIHPVDAAALKMRQLALQQLQRAAVRMADDHHRTLLACQRYGRREPLGDGFGAGIVIQKDVPRQACQPNLLGSRGGNGLWVGAAV